MDDDNCPLPYVDFNKFCEYQTDLLLKETDSFFKQHNLRLRKYVLPVKLPEWAKTFSEVLDRGQEYEPLTTIYRHKHFLKCRILHNYSYIETKWNRSNDVRNKNIPFDLRPLTSEILNQLDIINEDMMDPEFSGLLVTLNTNTYGEIKSNNESDNKDLKILMNGVMSSEFNGTYGLNGDTFQVKDEGSVLPYVNGFGRDRKNGDNNLRNNTNKDREQKKSEDTGDMSKLVDKEEKDDRTKDENKDNKDKEKDKERDREDKEDDGEEKPVNGKISKIIAGALVECLVTNERCIKSIWVHPDLSKHSSRIVLQSFLPRLMYEIFLLPSVITDKGVSTYNKFTYIMHNDLDLFPRQCWLLLASNKKMSLPRHYEPSTFEEHPVQLEYGDCHTDEVGYLFSKHRHRNMPINLSSFNRLASYKYSDYVTDGRNVRETRRNSNLRNEKNNNQNNRNEKKEYDFNDDRDSENNSDEDEKVDEKENKGKYDRVRGDRDKDKKVKERNNREKDNKDKSGDKNREDLDVHKDREDNRSDNESEEDGKRTRRQKRNTSGNNHKSSPKNSYSVNNGNYKNKNGLVDNEKNNKEKNKNSRSERRRRENDDNRDEDRHHRSRSRSRDDKEDKEHKDYRDKEKDKDNSRDKRVKERNNREKDKDNKEKGDKNREDKDKEVKKEGDDKERLTKLIGSNTGLKQLKELFLQVGSVTSTRDVCCTCRREKLTKSVDDQAWLDRLVGCTENYMYLMLPKRCERSRLGLLVRDGWRDLLTPHLDPVLMNDLNNLLPEYARNDGFFFKNNTVNYNADVEEWCRLRREDLIDVTSDTEVYMRLPDNCN